MVTFVEDQRTTVDSGVNRLSRCFCCDYVLRNSLTQTVWIPDYLY